MPVGRRVVLGMLGLGTLGVFAGRRVQHDVSSALAAVQNADRSGVTGLIPTGDGFRYYSVTGGSPSVSRAGYRLHVTGLVSSPAVLSFDDLRAMRPTGLTRDFQCVTGWRVENVAWVGVALADLLDRVGVKPEARAITFRSLDGVYTDTLTLEQARRRDVLVAYEMLGAPVRSYHGGPVRLYVAPMYGYKSVKWLGDIEVTDRVHPGYWENLGYDVDAWVGRSNGRSDERTS